MTTRIGICAPGFTKKLYYYGVRVQVIGSRQPGTLPAPASIGVRAPALMMARCWIKFARTCMIKNGCGDKAYHRLDAEAIRQAQNLTVLTPVKKQKGLRYLEP